MKIDPIKVEKNFELVCSEIARAGSERVQLQYIYNFLKSLNHLYNQFDSYIIQLFELFPSLKHPLLFTGFRPDELEAIINTCEEAVKAIPELQGDKSIQQKLDLLITGQNFIKSWLGVRKEGGGNGTLQLNSNWDKNRKAEDQPGEVFIPVVETTEGFSKKGRLRKLRVELVGKSGKGEFELRPVFGVIGADTGKLGEKPGKAAGKLLQESVEKCKYWRGTASFELSHTWHAGSSVNLALSSLFYCEMLKAENQREYFQINPGIAITGDIDEKGHVLEVDDETLLQKTEAAFFSWIQVLVVPVQQLDKTAEILDELQEEFTQRNLILKGVGNLRDLFFDRRLTLHKKTSLIEHTAKRVWKRRYSTMTIFAFLMLTGIIGFMAYGPIDKNPEMVSIAGEYLILENDRGLEISRINIGEVTAEYMSRNITAKPTYILHDINNDKINELIWGNSLTSTFRERSFVQAWSVSGDSVIWELPIRMDYQFPRQHVKMNGYLTIDELAVIGEKLIVSASFPTFFQSMISSVDIKDGTIEQEYVHIGNTNDMLTADIDEDEKEEIILTGVNNAFWTACLIILDPEYMQGHSPLTEEYQIENLPRAKEMYYILIPKTVVGKYLTKFEKFNVGRNLSLDKERKSLYASITETTRKFGNNTEYASVLAYFNFNMEPIGFGTSDLYDIIARELYQSGDIPFIPNYDYFQAFKDSLLYWNGEEFVNEVSMNREYLEMLGENED